MLINTVYVYLMHFMIILFSCMDMFLFVLFFRFLFVLLGPKGKARPYHEIGRAIGTLMSDEVCLLGFLCTCTRQ